MNEEIFGGIRAAVNKGETLQEAMMTFYNAGYKKDEINEAAKAFQLQRGAVIKSPPIKKKKPLIGNVLSSKKVSSYSSPKPIDKTKKLLLTMIAIASVLFIGLLIFFMLSR